VAVAARRDPTTPAELALAIPACGMDRWISWMPLHRVHSALQSRADAAPAPVDDGELPDIAFPTFRVPSEREESGEE
jgi:hypothetical protein